MSVMDLTEYQIPSVLTKSLTGFRGMLEAEQKLHQSVQPRLGKGAELAADIFRNAHFEMQTQATEICLQFVSALAATARNMASGNPTESTQKLQCEAADDVFGTISPMTANYGSFVPTQDEKPYMNPFTSQMIYPKTAFSASSSSDPTFGSKSQVPPSPSLNRPFFGRKNVEPLIPRPNYGTPDSSPGSNSVIWTPVSSNTSSPARDRDLPTASGNNNHDVFEADRALALRLQAQWDAEDSVRDAAVNINRGTSLLRGSTTMRTVNETQQRKYAMAQEIGVAGHLDAVWRQEETLNQSTFEALRDSQKRQETWLQEQSEFAARLQRQEEEAASRPMRDLQAAREVQQQNERTAATIQGDFEFARAVQHEWAKEAAGEAMVHRKFTVEYPGGVNKAQQQVPSATAQLQRQGTERVRQPLTGFMQKCMIPQRKQGKEQGNIRHGAEIIAGAEAKKAPRQSDCVVCMDAHQTDNVCILPCTHAYCGKCLTTSFASALKSKKLFSCCTQNVPIAIGSRWLTISLITRYNALALELKTPNPRYCSTTACGLFIPPRNVKGQLAVCPVCSTRTCTLCLRAEHSGVCAQDKEGQAMQRLAKKKGWKSCPGCNFTIQKTEGCLHMSCKCGLQFCWSCLRNWGTCNSTCPRR